MSDENLIPQDHWEAVVRHSPLVSVDLVVQNGSKIILGKRTNEPAKGEWFVPGGVVFKNEGLEEAVYRVAETELGVSVTIDRQLGVYEHFWDTSEIEGVETKHYVPLGFLVTVDDDECRSDDQHARLRQFAPPFEDLELHPYIRDYLADADLL